MSAFQQSASDFQSLVGNWEQSYDSARSAAFAEDAEKSREDEIKGSELLNIVAPAGLKLFQQGLERSNLTGKITQTLDDVQGKMSPLGAKAFQTLRNVGSDLLGLAPGKVGHVLKASGLGEAVRGGGQVRQPGQPRPAPNEEPVPEGREMTTIGGGQAPEELPAIQETSFGLTPAGQAPEATEAPTTTIATTAPSEPTSSVPTGQPPLRTLASFDGLSPEQLANSRFGGMFAGQVTRTLEQSLGYGQTDHIQEAPINEPTFLSAASSRFGVLQRPTILDEPTANPTAEFNLARSGTSAIFSRGAGNAINQAIAGGEFLSSQASTAATAATGALGLAAGQLTGTAQQAVGGASLGLGTVQQLAEGELPTGALLAGVNAGLSQLGTRGAEAAQGLNVGVGAATIGRTVGNIASGVKNAIGITPSTIAAPTVGTLPETTGATTLSGQAAELLGTNIGSKVGQLATTLGGETAGGVLGGDAGESVVAGLTQATVDSLAGDTDPVGWVVSAGLGLITGLTALGESIKDLFDPAHSAPVAPPPLPSFQSGVSM